MKSYYSCIDGSLSAPQPVQHTVIRDRVAKAGGSVTFYGAEDVQTLGTQPFIRLKLTRMKETALHGVVFYTFRQFCHGEQINYELIRYITGLGLEVLFACEGIAIRTDAELEQWLPFLTAIDYAARRDRSAPWQSFIRSVDLDTVPSL